MYQHKDVYTNNETSDLCLLTFYINHKKAVSIIRPQQRRVVCSRPYGVHCIILECTATHIITQGRFLVNS